MEQFLQTLWEASIQGSIIILAVLLLRLFLKKSPRQVCLLWLLALLRLALPVISMWCGIWMYISARHTLPRCSAAMPGAAPFGHAQWPSRRIM